MESNAFAFFFDRANEVKEEKTADLVKWLVFL